MITHVAGADTPDETYYAGKKSLIYNTVNIKIGYLNNLGAFLQKTTICFNFNFIFLLWSKISGPPSKITFLFNILKTKMERVLQNTCLMLQQKLKELIICSKPLSKSISTKPKPECKFFHPTY